MSYFGYDGQGRTKAKILKGGLNPHKGRGSGEIEHGGLGVGAPQNII